LQNIETYERILPTLLAASCLQRPLIIILDGIDQVRGYSSKSIEWLPATLPENIKLVLSVSEGSDFYVQIAKRINQNTFIKMPLLGEAEAKGILMSSVMQYNHSVNSKIQDCVLKSVQECTLPLYSKVLAWQTSWWADKEHDIVPKGHVNDQLSLMLEELETILGVTQVQHALAIITSTKHGVTDSEMIDLLAFDDNFHSTTTYGTARSRCFPVLTVGFSGLGPGLLDLVQAEQAPGPVPAVDLDGGRLGGSVEGQHAATSCGGEVQGARQVGQPDDLRLLHCKYLHALYFPPICGFQGKWWTSKPANLSARLVSQETILGKWYGSLCM
jgi:hypothetical protein